MLPMLAPRSSRASNALVVMQDTDDSGIPLQQKIGEKRHLICTVIFWPIGRVLQPDRCDRDLRPDLATLVQLGRLH